MFNHGSVINACTVKIFNNNAGFQYCLQVPFRNLLQLCFNKQLFANYIPIFTTQLYTFITPLQLQRLHKID